VWVGFDPLARLLPEGERVADSVSATDKPPSEGLINLTQAREHVVEVLPKVQSRMKGQQPQTRVVRRDDARCIDKPTQMLLEQPYWTIALPIHETYATQFS
jgi:hypothetical protein